MSEADEEFARFMNILRMRYDRKDWGLDLDPTGMWKFPAKSDQWFLEAMEDIAPEIIDRWMRYLAEKGNLTLDQAFFGSGSYAKREGNSLSKKRNSLFLEWVLRFQLYERGRKAEYPNLWKLRHDTYAKTPELGTPGAPEKAWYRWCEDNNYSPPDK